MSYAIAPTFENNRIGVRRLRTISGVGGLRGTLGDDATTAYQNALIGAGYDPGTINTLIALGATSLDLAALYSGSIDTATLMNQLSGASVPAGGASSSATSFPAAAIPQNISSGFGTFDLSQPTNWSTISSLFSSTQTQLNALAAQNPSDPNVVQNVAQLQSLTSQWGAYYGLAQSGAITSTGTQGLAVPTGTVAAIAGLVVALYAIYQFAKTYQVTKATTATAAVQTSTAQQLTSTYNGLVQQAAAAQAGGNTTQAAALTTQANAVLAQIGTIAGSAAPATSLQAWFTANWAYLLAGLAAIAIGPNLVKKL